MTQAEIGNAIANARKEQGITIRCCGKTFAQAEANYRKGICDNWADF